MSKICKSGCGCTETMKVHDGECVFENPCKLPEEHREQCDCVNPYTVTSKTETNKQIPDGFHYYSEYCPCSECYNEKLGRNLALKDEIPKYYPLCANCGSTMKQKYNNSVCVNYLAHLFQCPKCKDVKIL